MKRLQGKALGLGALNLLTRSELKKVVGGEFPIECASCTYKTANGNSHTVTCNKNATNTGCVCPDGLGCATRS
jgi:hypothetical protein